jgi:hypothetical protein
VNRPAIPSRARTRSHDGRRQESQAQFTMSALPEISNIPNPNTGAVAQGEPLLCQEAAITTSRPPPMSLAPGLFSEPTPQCAKPSLPFRPGAGGAEPGRRVMPSSHAVRIPRRRRGRECPGQARQHCSKSITGHRNHSTLVPQLRQALVGGVTGCVVISESCRGSLAALGGGSVQLLVAHIAEVRRQRFWRDF